MTNPLFVITTMPDSIHYNSPTPYTLGEFLDPITHLPASDNTLAFNASEDTVEWERLADARLAEAGYKRLTPWTDFGMEARALIQQQPTH